MTFTIKVPNMQAFKAYAVDLLERVGSTFAESALAGITMGVATGANFWETAGVTALFALAKGLLAYFVPSIGNLKTAGLLSWILAAIVKSPTSPAVVTTVSPIAVAQITVPVVQTVQHVVTDVQTDIVTPPTLEQAATQVEQAATEFIAKVSGADE